MEVASGRKTTKKIIIFGTGNFGMQAFNEFRENVYYFADNDPQKQGTYMFGIKVLAPAMISEMEEDYEIVVAVKKADDVIAQLDSMGIINYRLYTEDAGRYYPTKEIVWNPYEGGRGFSECGESKIQQMLRDIGVAVEKSNPENTELNHVEIETYNRCNGGCSFCPVSVKNDTRQEMYMPEKLFRRIIDDLSDMDYSGRLALFSNNEPFLDERIVDFHRYAREKLPKARMHLFTNGTKLSIKIFREVIECLDELIIDNYSQKLELIPNNRAIKEYVEEYPSLREKVTIVLRKPNEILSNRGGDAPNGHDSKLCGNATCILPFRQMIIRPDGKISLCCNDPLGRVTLGDLTKKSVIEVWNDKEFIAIREKLKSEGRSGIEKCKGCDYLALG